MYLCGIHLFYLTIDKIFMGHASNTTFIMFSLSFLGLKDMLAPFQAFGGGHGRNAPPPGTVNVLLSSFPKSAMCDSFICTCSRSAGSTTLKAHLNALQGAGAHPLRLRCLLALHAGAIRHLDAASLWYRACCGKQLAPHSLQY